jgi:hypothetical protein
MLVVMMIIKSLGLGLGLRLVLRLVLELRLVPGTSNIILVVGVLNRQRVMSRKYTFFLAGT